MPKGFLNLTPERRREIASRGGKAAHALGRAHRFTTEQAKEAGRKGGASVVAKKGVRHMAEIGRKGGAAVSRDSVHMAEIGRKGGLVR